MTHPIIEIYIRIEATIMPENGNAGREDESIGTFTVSNASDMDEEDSFPSIWTDADGINRYEQVIFFEQNSLDGLISISDTLEIDNNRSSLTDTLTLADVADERVDLHTNAATTVTMLNDASNEELTP